MVYDPPLRTGDIVWVDLEDLHTRRSYVAMLVRITPGEGAWLQAWPGKDTSAALARCYHATEAQKAKYFLNLLQHGGE